VAFAFSAVILLDKQATIVLEQSVMPPQKSPIMLTGAQLRLGYEASIENAIRLAHAAGKLLDEYPDKGLGLAQLGQEEVGKSLSLLAAGALPRKPAAWAWLWDDWRNHQLKAHRAYRYEIIHHFRIAAEHPDGGEYYDGGPLLDRLSAEKEVSFYVDYDAQLKTFVSPRELVDHFAASARVTTVLYLAGTADAIRRALMRDDHVYRFREFAKVALTICTQDVYQQDWPSLRDSFADKSPHHAAIIEEIQIALKGTADTLKEIFAEARKRRVASARSTSETGC
jgi:AbiV family abortive infection protein